jgi:hypothetical protein
MGILLPIELLVGTWGTICSVTVAGDQLPGTAVELRMGRWPVVTPKYLVSFPLFCP